VSGIDLSDRQTVAPVLANRLGLVDAVDHLLNRGAVVTGDATISLAGVDLVYLRLSLLLSSVETLRESATSTGTPAFRVQPAPGPDVPRGSDEQELGYPHPAAAGLSPRREGQGESRPLSSGPAPAVQKDDPARGLARLILTLVEALRQILERQSLRRAESGTLSDEVVEQLGVALLDLEGKMAELRRIFDLSEEDLNVDLGPFGQLL
jgi:hypothetical protein